MGTYTQNIHNRLLVRMHHQKKIALKIAAKIASVNRSYVSERLISSFDQCKHF